MSIRQKRISVFYCQKKNLNTSKFYHCINIKSCADCKRGLLIGKKCVCEVGYTGEKCDIALFDPMLFNKDEEIDIPFVINTKTELIRLKRTVEKEYSGREEGSSPPKEPRSCPPGTATRSSEEYNCLDVLAFSFQLLIANDIALQILQLRVNSYANFRSFTQ